MNSSERHPSTALVLGGGGSAGNAWLIGVMAGLFDEGSDVTSADLIVGTSAGSTGAAQITSASPPDLLTAILTSPIPSRPAGGGGINHLERTAAVIAASSGSDDMRRRMGESALALGPAPAGWRATVASRLPCQNWPVQKVVITAVDAETGDPVFFDRESGIDLADAIAASCAGGYAHAIGDRSYIDGGYRSVENADLALGYDRVLVLSPLGGCTRMPLDWGMHLSAQVDALRGSGSVVETIVPSAESLAAFGNNLMDLSTRAPAARAGFEQGRAAAEHVSTFWPRGY